MPLLALEGVACIFSCFGVDNDNYCFAGLTVPFIIARLNDHQFCRPC